LLYKRLKKQSARAENGGNLTTNTKDGKTKKYLPVTDYKDPKR
jgi:hypothetical protein